MIQNSDANWTYQEVGAEGIAMNSGDLPWKGMTKFWGLQPLRLDSFLPEVQLDEAHLWSYSMPSGVAQRWRKSSIGARVCSNFGREQARKKIKAARDLQRRQRPFYRPTWAVAFIWCVELLVVDRVLCSAPPSYLHPEEEGDCAKRYAAIGLGRCWASARWAAIR
jgi:hypothetical protein